MSRSIGGLLFVSCVLMGCGQMTEPGPTCGSAGRTGESNCSDVSTCNAGQYCDDSGFPTCTPGCTSDQNCGPNEFCARPVGEAIGACQACPVCGNGACEAGETTASCASDCGGAAAVCGNGACEAGESAAACPADCNAGPVCGNRTCEVGESAAACPVDCSGGPVCGNGACEPGENPGSCAADCVVGPVCGNGACEPGENPASCAADCVGGPVCGNGACEPGESPASCVVDCSDDTLAECLDHCDSYNFFSCFVPGGLQTCRDLCAGATMASREQFDVCAGSGSVSCDESCFDFL